MFGQLRSLISDGSSSKLLQLLDQNITFECSFAPLAESLYPVFRPRNGIRDYIQRHNFLLHNTTMLSNKRIDEAVGDGVAYFTQVHSGPILIDGSSAEWESLTKVLISAGKIYKVVFTVIDGQPIDEAYQP